VGNPIYDSAEHKAERRRWAPVVASGQAMCCEIVCLMPSRSISPSQAWDLAHDRVSGGYLGPSHPRCNRSEGGKEKHRRAKARRRWVL
jgi:hypothetical protein